MIRGRKIATLVRFGSRPTPPSLLPVAVGPTVLSSGGGSNSLPVMKRSSPPTDRSSVFLIAPPFGEQNTLVQYVVFLMCCSLVESGFLAHWKSVLPPSHHAVPCFAVPPGVQRTTWLPSIRPKKKNFDQAIKQDLISPSYNPQITTTELADC